MTQVQWKTQTLVILDVGFFGVGPARRANVMADLRQQIWSAGGMVATPQSDTEVAATAAAAAAAEVAVSAACGKHAGSGATVGGEPPADGRAVAAASASASAAAAAAGEEDAVVAALAGESSRAMMLPLTRTASIGGGGGQGTSPQGLMVATAATSALARGGGVDRVGTNTNGSGGGGGGGRRPGLGKRAQSISAALTQDEGLIHKVNAGLSGSETNIFFQLMLPESTSSSSPPPSSQQRFESGRASLRAGAAGAAPTTAVVSRSSGSGPWGAPPLVPTGPYPTFSGDAPKGLVAGPGERFAGLSNSRYVASYLRRRRWLWFFACDEVSGHGDGGGSGGVGGPGGEDHAGVSPSDWNKRRRMMINALARSRRADGFVLVELRDDDALMVKGVRIMLGVQTGGTNEGGGRGGDGGGGGGGGRWGGGGRGEPRAMRMILQYRVFEAGHGTIGTELLMEPQHGHVWVERQQGSKDSAGGGGGGSFWMSDKDLFQHLIRYVDAADLRILSAFKSYFYLQHKSEAAAQMSPIARARDHAATAAMSSAAAAHNSGWDIPGASRAGPGGRRGGVGSRQSSSGSAGGASGMETYPRRQSSPGRVPQSRSWSGSGSGSFGDGGSRRGGARDGGAGDDADVLSEVAVPVSLINLVVHADQRRAPLRMFHFADALPSLPPPPPPPPAHNTPSPRKIRQRPSRGGPGGGAAGGARDSGEVGQLPTTKEGVVMERGGGVGEKGAEEQQGRKDDAGRQREAAENDDGGCAAAAAAAAAPAARHCATCEVLPVVQIDDNGDNKDGDGAGSPAVGDGRQGGTAGCRGRGGSVHEGDLSTNEQMHGLLEKVLEDAQNVSVPWAITSSDLIPPSNYLVANSSSGSSSGNNAASRVGGGRSGGHCNAGPASPPTAGASSGRGGVPGLAPPILKGASGPLPSELAMRGRWFSRTIGDGAILLTFLPALDEWRKEVSARLEQRRALREARKTRKWKKSGRKGLGRGGASAGKGGDKDEDDSLGLFLFLVRSGDFGLPIEPQSARLRDIRRILLAHIPRSHHRAMAFKPAERIGWGDDPGGGRVGTLARSYQGLVNLEHRRAFLRVVYSALREGRVLCSGDLAFALSGCGETAREVNITRLRRVVLDNGTAEGAPRADPADAAQQAEPDKAACDVEFTSILSRYLRPVPGTAYYIYWESEYEGWGAANIQQASSASAGGGAAASAAAGETLIPPHSVTETSLTTTAAAAGHRWSGPVADNMAAALVPTFRGGSPHDNNSSTSSSTCANQSLQGRSSSLSAVTDPAMVAASCAAAAAETCLASFPLFVRFEVVHDETACVDGTDGDAAAMATVAAAAASGEGDENEQDGRVHVGNDAAPGSFPDGAWQQQRRRHRSRGCVVDTSHTLSRALKSMPDVARAGQAVGRFDGAGACADGEGLGGAQSHLCILATTFPASDWSRSASSGAEAGAGGDGHSPVKTAARFGQYCRPRTLSTGDLAMVHGGGGGGGLRIGGGSGGSGTTMPIVTSLARLTEALRKHIDKIYCSEVLRSLLRCTPVTIPTLLTVRRCLRPLPAEEITRFLVPLEFMVDISTEPHSTGIGPRGLRSIAKARELLDQELLRGKAPCFRRAKEEDEEDDDDDGDGAQETPTKTVSDSLRQDIEAAKGLLFVVEEGVRAGGEGAAPSLHGCQADGRRNGATRADVGVDDNVRDDGDSSRHPAAANDDYSVPYWGIVRVGELTNDPGEVPEPWPLYGASRARTRQLGKTAHAFSKPSEPTPASQVHRFGSAPESVGYRLIVINVKVSVHHPRGSTVSANKGTVIDEIKRGLHLAARRVNQLMLLESLIQTKVACEVLIPPPHPPATTTTALDMPEVLRVGAVTYSNPRARRPKANALTGAAGAPLGGVGGGFRSIDDKGVGGRGGLLMQSPPPAGTGSPEASAAKDAGVVARDGAVGTSSAFVAPESAAGTDGNSDRKKLSPTVDSIGPGGEGFLSKASTWAGCSLTVDTRSVAGGVFRLENSLDTANKGSGSPCSSPTQLVLDGGGGESGRVVDGRATKSTHGGGGEQQQQQQEEGELVLPQRELGQAFREGELRCECKYFRRFPLYHRLQAQMVLVTLATTALNGFRVHGRSDLYVCPDKLGNFYMTLSEEASSQPAIELKVYGIEDLSTELKRRLIDKIEFELAKQGWEALSSQLGMNDHLNVTAEDWEFVRTGPNADPARDSGGVSRGGLIGRVVQEAISRGSGSGGEDFVARAADEQTQQETSHSDSGGGGGGGGSRSSKGSFTAATTRVRKEDRGGKEGAAPASLPGHDRAWFSLPAGGVLDTFLLLQYLRSVLCADGLMKILHSATNESQPPQSPQLEQPRQQSQLIPPPPRLDISFKGRGHRRRSTGSSPLARAYSQGGPGSASGSASVGGGRAGGDSWDGAAAEGRETSAAAEAVVTAAVHEAITLAGGVAVPSGGNDSGHGPPGVDAVGGLYDRAGSSSSSGTRRASAGVGAMAAAATTAAGARPGGPAARMRSVDDLDSSGKSERKARSGLPEGGSKLEYSSSSSSSFAVAKPHDEARAVTAGAAAAAAAAIAAAKVKEAGRPSPGEQGSVALEETKGKDGKKANLERSGSGEGKREDGAGGSMAGATRPDEGLVEDVEVDPNDLNFVYSSRQATTGVRRGDPAAKRTAEAARKVGEGLAFVKLWPLDAKTGARTPSLRTGFRPSPISELESRTSATGGGMDIEILAGADGLAAVAKAKAAAEAAASSAPAPLERSSLVPASVRASSPPSSLSSPPGSPAEIVHTAPDGAGLGASAAAVGGSDVGSGAGESSSRSASSLVDDNAVDNIGIEAMPEAAATGEAGRAVAGENKEATAAAPRWLALEVEVFAVGGINVPYMMFLITVCFEQALAEYMMERLLLRDRTGPSRGLPQSAAAAESKKNKFTELTRGSGHKAAAVAAATAGKKGNALDEGPPVRHRTPKDVKSVCTIVGRLADKAAGGTSPVTQQIVANESIPGWAVPTFAADLTQAICHQHSSFFTSTTAINLSKMGERPKTAILSSFAPRRPGKSNSTDDPGQYIIVLGLEFDGAPKTHVREDLEDAFIRAGGARGGRGATGAEGERERVAAGGASTSTGAVAGVAGGASGGSLHNRPMSSFALDPPHLKRQRPLLGIASGCSGSGSGSGGSGGASGGGLGGGREASSGRAGLSCWQQKVRQRGMFCVISVSTTKQWLTTYNFNPSFFEICRGAMASSITWARCQRVAFQNLRFEQRPRGCVYAPVFLFVHAGLADLRHPLDVGNVVGSAADLAGWVGGEGNGNGYERRKGRCRWNRRI
ncbi:unnamed protein product [Ectocarpus sp. CCAP 1310/34]|nr:unnamed protein product [Ectocarpus sp. CCAP 1310/34]